jgi:hypothetical protein
MMAAMVVTAAVWVSGSEQVRRQWMAARKLTQAARAMTPATGGAAPARRRAWGKRQRRTVTDLTLHKLPAEWAAGRPAPLGGYRVVMRARSHVDCASAVP